MDYLTILSIIVVIFIVYLGYTYIFMTSMIFSKPIDLKNSAQLSYAATLMKQPASTRYNYEFWVNVQSNNPVDEPHVLLNRGNMFAFVLTGSKLTLEYASTLAISSAGLVTTRPADTNIMTITSTFPFQKWTQIVMNVDGSRVDVYIDGKLYKTFSNISFGTDATTPITVGNSKTVAQMSRFSFWPNNVDPQTVWTNFTKGNGMGGLSSFFGKYKADMSILKDNQSVFNFAVL